MRPSTTGPHLCHSPPFYRGYDVTVRCRYALQSAASSAPLMELVWTRCTSFKVATYGVQVLPPDVCRSLVSSLSPSQSCQARRWVHDGAGVSSSVAPAIQKTGRRNGILPPGSHHSSSKSIQSFSLALLGYDLIRGGRTRAERVRPENIPPGISASVLGYSVYRSAMDAGWELITDQKPTVLHGVRFSTLGKRLRGRVSSSGFIPNRNGPAGTGDRAAFTMPPTRYHDDPNRLGPPSGPTNSA
ncbi:hypothetical protein V8C44DRAFT_72461 [Trichoderma aethiopicum]